MKEDNTLLWVGLGLASFFVLNKTQLVAAQSGPAAILPPAPAPTPGTPAAAPPTPQQAAAVPSPQNTTQIIEPVQSPTATDLESPDLAFGPYGY